MAEDNDWTAVVRNLRQVRQKWALLTQVLSREGADARKSGQIYLAVVQSFLLNRSETWVLTPRMQRVLVRFYHRVAHRLNGRPPQKGQDEGSFYPTMEDAMVEEWLQEVENYVSRLQNIVEQYIGTKPIMNLCLAAK